MENTTAMIGGLPTFSTTIHVSGTGTDFYTDKIMKHEVQTISLWQK